MNKKTLSLSLFLSVLAFVAVYNRSKFMGQITVSDSNSWQQNYKTSFIQSCEKLAIQEISQQYQLDSSHFSQEQLDQISQFTQDYCHCVSDKIEQTGPFRTIASSEEEVIEQVQNYLDSEEGMLATEACAASGS